MSKPYIFERIDTHGWSPDDDLENADWIRTLSWNLPTGLDEFLEYLGVSEDSVETQRQAVGQFIKLPAAKPMPDALRAELIRAGLISA